MTGSIEGARLANARGVPGTLGCFARTREGEDVALTNHHVVYGRKAGEGSAVWLVEDGVPSADLPRLGTAGRGRIGNVLFDGHETFVDCALVKLDGRLPRRRHASGIAQVRPGAHVEKTGAATGTTRGVVLDVEYPDVARLPERALPAPRQILVGALGDDRFSAEGDSGAAVVDEDGRIVGLLWGVNHRGESVASPAGAIATALDVEIAPRRRWFSRRP